jgi:hypothetical protein
MKPHNWIIKEGDAGPIGLYDYWECTECKASGGGRTDRPHPSRAFLAGAGLDLPEDCNESIRMIAAFREENRPRPYTVTCKKWTDHVKATDPEDALGEAIKTTKHVDTYEVTDEETGEKYSVVACYKLAYIEVIK